MVDDEEDTKAIGQYAAADTGEQVHSFASSPSSHWTLNMKAARGSERQPGKPSLVFSTDSVTELSISYDLAAEVNSGQKCVGQTVHETFNSL